jgi:glycosyltransferase involved in cell wall biosynthesis
VKTVSIIIGFFERIQYLRTCLNCIARQNALVEEVVIADDGSSEVVVQSILAMKDRYPFKIIHAWQPKNGFRLAASRNNGIRRASGDYLIFLDCDFALLDGAIAAHVRSARPGHVCSAYVKYLPEQETAGVIDGSTNLDQLERLYNALPDRPINRAHWKFIQNTWMIRFGLRSPRKFRCSSHFSMHRSDMERLNGYDEMFEGWGGEDEDLAHRMAKLGLRGTSIIRSARALHLWHPKELGGRHWREGSNVAYLNRPNVSPRCERGLVAPQA